MDPGTVIADRFEITRQAGEGGMGQIYRARDRRTGDIVALKVLRPEAASDAERFRREAEVIAGLDHPGIVAYVDCGLTADQAPYLAMEWLEGLTLQERLTDGTMTVSDAVTLALQVAGALAYAHARGLVHRDVKPANLYLCDYSVGRVKLLDFGIVRAGGLAPTLTASGETVGTPAYMAPEQARGVRELDARADLYGLGCVLFEALTGSRVFAADDPMSVLLRVVLEQPPRLDELRGGVPPALVELVAELLAKSPDARPPSAVAVIERLRAVDVSGPAAEAAEPAGRAAHEEVPTIPGFPRPALTDAEQRIRFVLLARARPDDPRRTALEGNVVARLTDAVRGHGGVLTELIDGTVLITFCRTGSATEQAAAAAQCALAVRSAVPSASLALVAAREADAGRLPMGAVIDRAVTLLRQPEAIDDASGVRLDHVVAGLLERRFVVAGDARGLCLVDERPFEQPRRTLLGAPTPTVGRDRELETLDSCVDGWLQERSSRAALILGGAGMGKSRLRAELVERLARRDERVQVWLGRGDPVSPGSPFGVIAAAMRGALGLPSHEPLAVSRHRLAARMGRHVPNRQVRRVTEFIGEVVGVPSAGDVSLQLQAARLDMRLMGDQIRRACEDWLRAECQAEPVVLLLEDLQWGDRASVRLVEALLRRLADCPLLVVACARHEVDELFPELFAALPITRVEVGDLPAEAGRQLVRAAVGAELPRATVDRLVERAGGNAFFLEELIRAVAQGQRDSFPETVLAVLQHRLGELSPLARRLLRAASVLGRQFSRDGLWVLLGESTAREEVEGLLETLVADEWITELARAGHPSAREYRFRHAFVREASYATLTADDRALGHRLAAAWLEQVGQAEPLTLAEHHERGGMPNLAVPWFLRAAEQALEGDDLEGAIARAERGIQSGATWESLGALLRVQAEALRWRGENRAAEQKAAEALRHLAPRSDLWYRAAAEAALSSGRLGHQGRLVELGSELGVRFRDQVPGLAECVALAATATQLLYAGQAELAQSLLERLAKAAGDSEDADPAVMARVTQARAVRAVTAGDPAETLSLLRRCVAHFERTGDLRNACIQQGNAGYVYLELGDYWRAETELREALQQAERLGIHFVSAGVRQNLFHALGLQGRAKEALALSERALAELQAQGNRRMLSAGHAYVAQILLRVSDFDLAEHHARQAAETAAGDPGRAYALAVIARIELVRGRVAAGHRAAHEARLLLQSLGEIDEGESLIRLTYAEALRAEGRRGRALRAILEARARLMQRAHKIADRRWRRSFLEQVAENARTLELADAWLRESPPPQSAD